MKQLPLLCFTLFISLYCQAQVYHSFLHDTAIWDETIIYPGSCDGSNGNAEGYNRKLIMMGDTVLNGGASIRKLYEQDYYGFVYQHYQLVFSSYSGAPPVWVGGISEDSLRKQVWFFNAGLTFNASLCSDLTIGTQVSLLLYDFNLRVGDSVAWKKYDPIVKSIDSVMTENGTYLHVFHFDTVNVDYWIEGLGSSLGLFGAYMPPPFECNCTLNCAQAMEFLNPGEKPCGGIYTSVPQPQEHSKLVVFPNPAHDKIILNFSLLKNTPATISILNETGQIVWNKNETVYRGNLIEEIPVTDLSRGIYFVRIETPEGSFVKMILLQ